MRVKVCGLTSHEDAATALELGADTLGFNFYPPSPRYIAPEEAGKIIRRLPPAAVTVGVFVNVASPAALEREARCAGVRILQLHGDEPPEYCRQLTGWPLIKAVRIGADFQPQALADYPAVEALLLDRKDEVLFGGTGRTFDWGVAAEIARLRRVILAGGLHAGNVAEAIRAVRPYGVDVCSGVESAPGRKDPVKLREFMSEVRNAVQEL